MATVAELGQKIKGKHPGVYDDLSDEDLGRKVMAKYPNAYADFSDSSGGKPIIIPPSQGYPEPKLMKATNPLISRGLELLPAAGGLAGGLLGSELGPGAIGTAGLGGAAGEAIRQGILNQGYGKPVSPLGIAGQGLGQAAAEATGFGLAKLAGAAARPLMRKSLGVVSTLAKRFRTTPEAIADIVLKERLPVTMAGERKVQEMGYAARGARNATIKNTGGTITADKLASVAIKDAERSVGRPLTINERRSLISTVQSEADAILTGRTHGAVPKTVPGQASQYSPWETEQIKEVAAKNARPAYRADQAAASVAADPALSKQIAAAARARLNKIPGITDQNARIKELMAAQQAIGGAVAKASGGWTPLHVGPVSVGLKLPREKTGNLALTLTSPRFQKLLRQSPRAAAELIVQLIHSDQPDQTGVSSVKR